MKKKAANLSKTDPSILPSVAGQDLHRNPPPLLRYALIIAVYLFAFIIFDIITKQFESLPGIVTWYPPAGITYALLLVFGVGYAPAVTIALFISSLFIYRMPQSPYLLFLWAFLISFIYGAAAAFLRRRIRFDWQLQKLRDMTWLVFTTIFVSALLAILSVFSSALSGDMPRSEVLYAIFEWWIGETVGVLTITPFLLIHVIPGLKRFVEGQPVRLPTRRSFPHPTLSAIGQTASLAFILYLVFGAPLLNEFHPLYLITLPLIWIALDHGLKGVSAGLVALNFGVVLALWFFRFDPAQMGELELLMIVNCIAGLLMGAIVTERKQADEALKESEKKYRLLHKSMVDGFVSVDMDGNFLECNQVYQDMLGYSSDELAKKTYVDITPEKWHEYESDIVANQIIKRGYSDIYEKEYRRKDGTIFPVELHTRLMKNEQGKPVGMWAIARDITERKQAEEKLKDSEKRFATIFRANPAAIAITRIDNGQLVHINEAWTEATGYTETEAIGHTPFELNVWVAPEQRARLMETLKQHGKARGEIQLRGKSGEIRDMLMSAELIQLTGETYLLTMAQDITERKRAEEALRETSERLAHMLANSPTVIYALKVEGDQATPLWVSNNAEKILGYTSDAPLQSDWWQKHIYPQDLPRVLVSLDHLFDDFYQHEYRFFHNNGRLLWLHDEHRLLRDADNKPHEIIGAWVDITERKRAEEALQKSEDRYRILFEKASDGIFYLSADLKILAVNESFAMMHGYRAEEMHSMNLQDLDTPETSRLSPERMRRILAGESVQFEAEHYHKDGHTLSLAVSASLISTGDEHIIQAFHRDITKRKQAEAQLTASEIRYHRLFDAARDGILIMDAETGVIMDVNPFLIGLLDISHEEILGKELWELGFFKDIAANKANFLELQQKEFIRYENLPLETADGRTINVEFSSYVYQVGHNKVVQCNIRDLTERKQAEEQLRFLYDASQRLNRTLDINEIYQTICDFMSAVAPNDGLAISAFDPETKLITCRAYWMDNKWMDVAPFPAIPLEEEGKGTQSIVIRTGQAMLINDYQALLKTTQNSYVVDSETNEVTQEIPPDDEETTRSALIVPLKIGGKVNGVIQVMSYRLNAYTENQLKLLDALALHIASAEQNARLYVQVQAELNERKHAEEEILHHVAELETIYENGLALNQLLSPEEIGQKIIQLLEQKMDWHHTAIRLYSLQDKTLEVLAFSQPNLNNEEERRMVEEHFNKYISKSGKGLTGWAIQNSQIIRSGNVSSDPRYIATYPGMYSGLYVPMELNQSVIGVISIESEKPNVFSEADERLVATLANQAAVAIENARLYQTAQQEIIERKRIENLLADERNQLALRVEERTADLSAANSDLTRALRSREEFLASMSHELRTPLTGILGFSEILQLNTYGELNEKQRKAIKIIDESGRHLLELISDILDLSKVEAGKLELQFTSCSIADVCQASLQLTKGMAQQKNQNIQYLPPPESIIVHADARRLKQILVNLLGNAVKFTPEGGGLGLEIQANASERKVRLIVWDKGIGIKSEDMHRLFKPFVQIDSSLAREYSGTGLGLSLAKRLVELHNGGIEVESVFGEGSRFTIILPWSSQDTIPIPNKPRRGTGELSSSVTPPEYFKLPLVMFADDNELVLQLVADFLEAKQYRVMKVRNGAELLESAAEFHPDIMLVDIQMPRMDGLETIRRIRSHPDPLVAAAPVIVLTALVMPGDRELCLREGANDYMSKPVKLKELFAAIQKLLKDKQ